MHIQMYMHMLTGLTFGVGSKDISLSVYQKMPGSEIYNTRMLTGLWRHPRTYWQQQARQMRHCRAALKLHLLQMKVLQTNLGHKGRMERREAALKVSPAPSKTQLLMMM